MNRCTVRFRTGPRILPAYRTEILQTERPELARWSVRTSSGSMILAFAALEIAAAAHVGIDRFVYPGEFSADLLNAGVGARHVPPYLPLISSTVVRVASRWPKPGQVLQ